VFFIKSYRSCYIIMYNSATSSVALLELTCPLDSEHNIWFNVLDLGNKTRPNIYSYTCRAWSSADYETIEISVLGHYQPSSFQDIRNFTDFIQPSNLPSDRSLIVQLEQVWRVPRQFLWPGTVVSGLLPT